MSTPEQDPNAPATATTGSCLCGAVAYRITGHLGIFQYCHCSRCRKVTGSAHASNLLVRPEHFRWLHGEEHVGSYEPEHTKYFTTAFCKRCGSNLPFTAKGGKSIAVPAGTLDAHPGITPSQSIFYSSRAPWYQDASALPKHDTLPGKS